MARVVGCVAISSRKKAAASSTDQSTLAALFGGHTALIGDSIMTELDKKWWGFLAVTLFLPLLVALAVWL